MRVSRKPSGVCIPQRSAPSPKGASRSKAVRLSGAARREKEAEKNRFAAAPVANESSYEGQTLGQDLLPFTCEAKRPTGFGRMKTKLRLGLPKGSLQEATLEKMAKAGWNISIGSRSYVPYVDDEELEIRLIRAQEISRYVENGHLDCGLTGYDWIVENDSDVHEVGEFLFSKVSRQPTRWVLAVPEDSPIKSVNDLQGKRIATEVVNITKRYLKEQDVQAEVEF